MLPFEEGRGILGQVGACHSGINPLVAPPTMTLEKLESWRVVSWRTHPAHQTVTGHVLKQSCATLPPASHWAGLFHLLGLIGASLQHWEVSGREPA